MKRIYSFFIFFFTINAWCQYEELNNAQWLSINNSKMIDIVKLNQNYLNQNKVIKIKAKILKSTKFLDSLHVLSTKVLDSIKSQVLHYNTMLNVSSEKRKVIRLCKKIKSDLYKLKKITTVLVLQLDKKRDELDLNILLRLQKKLVWCLFQIKKHTDNLEKRYMFSLKGSRAY